MLRSACRNTSMQVTALSVRIKIVKALHLFSQPLPADWLVSSRSQQVTAIAMRREGLLCQESWGWKPVVTVVVPRCGGLAPNQTPGNGLICAGVAETRFDGWPGENLPFDYSRCPDKMPHLVRRSVVRAGKDPCSAYEEEHQERQGPRTADTT